MKLFLLWIALLTPAGQAAPAAILEAYLATDFPARIEHIAAGEQEITLRGKAGSDLLLAEFPISDLLEPPTPLALTELSPHPDGTFSIPLPRKADGRDRLLSRWQLVTKSGKPASHFHYADDVPCRTPQAPAMKPRSKKGLGGWSAGPYPGELEALGIDAITVNVVLNSLVSLTAEADSVPFTWEGQTYHAREPALARLDETFVTAEQRGAMVSAILLVSNPAKGGDAMTRLLGHPDARPEGMFAMPNLSSGEGARLYGAILNLMAERWSKAGGPHGRVHHWIMHNEVDAGWEWTNAGDKPDIVYLEIYQRSMRLMDLIARQYDPHSRPFISLTHHWSDRGQPRWYGSKRLLDLLARFNAAEGNFAWGLAYHPYPQNLFEPKTWQDGQATFSFDTKKITPNNLEVLDAYLKQARFLDRGNARPIHLSENGFNSKDYSEAVLAEQAAGMAMAWKKIQRLSAIESWQYHNWIDNRHEGGLRIGLRKFPDEPGDPAGKKPIWHLYQALGTEREEEACAPYLKVIGITKWDEILHEVR